MKKNKIRRFRRVRDITQQQLAEKVGVSRQYIQKIESEKGYVSSKQEDKIIKMIIELGKELSYEH